MCVCVCKYVHTFRYIRFRADGDILLSFSVMVIMFEGPVTAEVYLVLSDVLCCAVVYVLSLMGGLCIIKLFCA